MAGSVRVHAEILGKGKATHNVWVRNTANFGAAILDLVASGIMVVVSPIEEPEDKCISISEMPEAFGFLKHVEEKR